MYCCLRQCGADAAPPSLVSLQYKNAFAVMHHPLLDLKPSLWMQRWLRLRHAIIIKDLKDNTDRHPRRHDSLKS